MRTSLSATCVGLLLLCVTAVAAPAKDNVAAAMVYRLTKFVDWPVEAFADSSAGFNICFSKPTPIYQKLKSANLKKWRGRDISVAANVTDQCHVAVLDQVDLSLVHKYRLTIGFTETFIDTGGHIELQFKRGRVVFAINHTLVRDAGLTVSSELLSLAGEVR